LTTHDQRIYLPNLIQTSLTISRQTAAAAILNFEQEAPLSPSDPRDALYQLKCWPIIVRITQTDT